MKTRCLDILSLHNRLLQHFHGRRVLESPGLVPVQPSGDAGSIAAFKGVSAIDPDGGGTFDVSVYGVIVVDCVILHLGAGSGFRKRTFHVLPEPVVGSAGLGHVDVNLHDTPLSYPSPL